MQENISKKANDDFAQKEFQFNHLLKDLQQKILGFIANIEENRSEFEGRMMKIWMEGIKKKSEKLY